MSAVATRKQACALACRAVRRQASALNANNSSAPLTSLRSSSSPNISGDVGQACSPSVIARPLHSCMTRRSVNANMSRSSSSSTSFLPRVGAAKPALTTMIHLQTMHRVNKKSSLPSSYNFPELTREFATTAVVDYARMTLIGRTTKEAESLTTSTGKEMLIFLVASDDGPVAKRGFDPAENDIASSNFSKGDDTGDGQQQRYPQRATSYFRVVSFAQGARRDFLMGLSKGTLVAMQADAKSSSYLDPETDRRIYRVDLVERDVQILSRPRLE